MLHRTAALVSLSLLLSGCPGEEPKPVAVQPLPHVERKEDIRPSLPEVDTPPDETDPQPVDQPPAEVPAVDFSDIPPAPPGFTGEDPDPLPPIPPEVQRKLKSYDDGYVADAIELLNYPHPAVRFQAADRLGYLDREEHDIPAVVQALRGALQDPSSAVRKVAAGQLHFYAPESTNALPELAKLMYDEDKEVVDNALYAIGGIGADAAPLVPQLVELLTKEENKNRGDVIDALADIGPAAKPAIPHLVELMESFNYTEDAAEALGHIGAERELQLAMSSDSDSVRMHAADGAGFLASHAPKTVALLIKIATSDSYEYGRGEAAKSLGAVRPTTKEIVAALGKASADEDETVRREAVTSLGKSEPALDEAIPFLLTATKDKEEWVRERATAALGKFKGSPEARLESIIDQLVEGVEAYSGQEAALESGAVEFYPLLKAMAVDETLDDIRRAAAILGLVELYGNGEFMTDEVDAELLPLAENLMGGNHPADVRGAAAMLYHFNRNSDDYSQALRDAFLDGLNHGTYIEVRKDAALILSHKRYTKAIPGLIAMLDESEQELQDAAVDGLADFNDDASAAIPALIKLANNKEYPRRYAPISAIGKIAGQPEVSAPALMKLLDDEQENVRTSSATALANVIAENDLDATAAVAKILKLYDEEKIDKHSLVTSLDKLGPASAPGVDRLVGLLNTKYLKDDVADALGEIGPAAKDAVPALIEAAVTWEDYQYSAINAIAEIKSGGAEFAKVAPQLLENLDTRSATLKTLGALGPDAASTAPLVAKLLESEDRHERSNAAEALGQMGEAAKPYVPQLKKVATEDEEEWVRDAANKSLLKLTPDDPEVLEAMLAGADEMGSREVRDLLETLGDRAPTVITDALKSEKPALRASAVRLLPEVMEAEKATPLLTAALEDEQVAVRTQAALHLHRAGKTSPKLTSVFLESLGGDNSWEMRRALEDQGRAVIDPLIDIVIDPSKDDETRQGAAEMLESLRDEARVPTAKLLAALQHDDSKHWAAVAMSIADPKDQAAMPVLIEMVTGDNEEQRQAGMNGLQRLKYPDGVMPSQLFEALLGLVNGDDENLARQAAAAISNRKVDAKHLPAILDLLNNDTTRENGLLMVYRGAIVDPQLVPPLVEVLKSGNEQQRAFATSGLRQQGDLGRAALMKVFIDDEAPTAARKAAGDGLLSMRAETTEDDQPQVAALLKSDQSALRQRAAVMLARSGYEWAPLQVDVLAAMGSGDYAVMYPARSALYDRREAMAASQDALIDLLDSGNETQAAFAAGLLGDIKEPSPPVIDALLQTLLKSDEERLDNIAAALLSENLRTAGRAAVLKAAATASDAEKLNLLMTLNVLGSEPADQLSDEIALARAALDSDNEAVQRQGAIALAHLDSKSSEPVSILAKHLVDDEGDLDYDVQYALRQLGPQAKEVVPALLKLLDDDRHKYNALQMLTSIGPDAAPAVPKATKLLAEERYFHPAAELLGSIGPAAQSATPALLAQLDNPRRMRLATAALAKMETPNDKLLPALYKHLKNPHLRYDAVAALGYLGERGGEALPVLNRALAMKDPELTITAAQALGRLGPVAAESADELVKALADEDDEVRARVASALGEIASQPEQCVPALAKAIQDRDEDVRYEAVEALAIFKADAAPAVPALIELLNAEDHRAAAIRCLGVIGPAAKAAVPKLVKLFEGENAPYLKRACASSLWKIDPAAAKAAGAEEEEE